MMSIALSFLHFTQCPKFFGNKVVLLLKHFENSNRIQRAHSISFE